MRTRRMRRRLFNVFAFACLAFAIYLIAFKKEESRTLSTSQTAQHAATGAKEVANN